MHPRYYFGDMNRKKGEMGWLVDKVTGKQMYVGGIVGPHNILDVLTFVAGTVEEGMEMKKNAQS